MKNLVNLKNHQQITEQIIVMIVLKKENLTEIVFSTSFRDITDDRKLVISDKLVMDSNFK